jgi:hypothetical protein
LPIRSIPERSQAVLSRSRRRGKPGNISENSHLRTFQRNTQASHRARSFALAQETDGAGNEAKEPNALYLWKR